MSAVMTKAVTAAAVVAAQQGRLLRGSSGWALSRRAMGSLIVERHASPEQALRYDNSKVASVPKGAFDIIVEMKASQVTVEDIKQIRGFSFANGLGIGGSSGVGVVTAVDTNNQFRAGDLVFVIGRHTWADHVTVGRNCAYKLPSMSITQAACLPSYLSAWGILDRFGPLPPSSTIVQNTADGAVARAVVQLATSRGHKVISFDNVALQSRASAAELREQPKVSFAVSGVTGKPSQAIFRLLSDHGSMVFYESSYRPAHDMSGIDMSVSSAIFNDRRVLGFDWASWALQNPFAVQRALATIGELIATKVLDLSPSVHPVIDAVAAVEATEHNAAAHVLTF